MANEEAKKMQKKHFQEVTASWNKWRDELMQSGARRGHRATKTPEMWRYQLTQGQKEGTAAERLRSEVQQWGDTFHAEDEPDRDGMGDLIRWVHEGRDDGDQAAMDMINEDMVWYASKSFKEATTATDGWHPRHFALLSAGASRCIARLLHACEGCGRFPTAQEDVIVFMMRKPDGGNRPIG